MDPAFLFALAIVAASALVALATLVALGSSVVGVSDGVTGGGLRRRPS